MTGAHDTMAFGEAIRNLGAAYGKPTLPERMVESMWQGLEDLPLSQVLSAMQLAKRESKFMPSVATIRASARVVEQSAPQAISGAPQLPPGEVWCRRCDDTGWLHATTQERSEDGPTLRPWQMANLATEAHERLRATWGENVPVYPNGRERISVKPCGCRVENPVYIWKRQQERRNAVKDAS